MIEEVHEEEAVELDTEAKAEEVQQEPEATQEEVNWQEKAKELEAKVNEYSEKLERTKNGTQSRINELTGARKQLEEQLARAYEELSQWKGEPAAPVKQEKNQEIDYKRAKDYGRFEYEVNQLKQDKPEVFQKLDEATKLGINPFAVNPELEMILASQPDAVKILPEIVDNNRLMDKLLTARSAFTVAEVFGEARASLNFKQTNQQPTPEQKPVNKPINTPSVRPSSSGNAPSTGRKTAEQILAELRSRR